MNKYSNGKIYTIRYRNDNSLIYVGSTCQELYKRFYKHKICCYDLNDRYHYNLKLYQKIRETNDLENWYIELYESFPCNNKQELNKREGEVIREIGNLNMCIAGRTEKEWRVEHKNYKKQKDKEYYENNKDKINERNKEYIDNNKDKINEYKKKWYEENKNKLHEKITCECGGCYNLTHKARHFKTKKHQDYIKSI